MGPAWLILADDLTGAADTAIAFARRRIPARVVWGDARPENHQDAVALAFDTASREIDAARAADRHTEILRRFMRPQLRLFKKIDSTLRGNPAEEIAAMLDVILAQRPASRIVLAPAFPAAGRTLVAGVVHVHGVPLPRTEFWPEGRAPALAHLVNLLETAGIAAQALPIETIRSAPEVLRAMLASKGVARGAMVSVCDSESDDDLERIAGASMDDDPAFFIGSAGLAHALARRASRTVGPRTPPHRHEPSARGALVVVGSRAQASRAALLRVGKLANVRRVSIESTLLHGDLQTQAHLTLARSVADALMAGTDVVVDVPADGVEQKAGNPELVVALARLLAPAARHASALAATGGETAAALLTRLGVSGLRLLDEIEPGISLGLTLGGISIPVVTKAGGFGNEECLMRIIERLRFIRQTGAVA